MHEGEGRGIERAPLERTHLDPSAANVGYADAEPARAFPRYSPPWRRALNQVIETEILPRLMMAHRAKAPGARKPRAQCPPFDVDAFTFALVDPDASVAPRLAERYRDDGASIEAVFLDLLAPAARKLGKMWETDERDHGRARAPASDRRRLSRQRGVLRRRRQQTRQGAASA